MIRLNKEPIEFKEDRLIFYACRYYSNNTLAIVCSTINGEPYADISINLEDYGYSFGNYWLNLNHSLTSDLKELVIKELVNEDTIIPISYGFSNSIAFRLKDKYVKIIEDNIKDL